MLAQVKYIILEIGIIQDTHGAQGAVLINLIMILQKTVLMKKVFLVILVDL